MQDNKDNNGTNETGDTSLPRRPHQQRPSQTPSSGTGSIFTAIRTEHVITTPTTTTTTTTEGNDSGNGQGDGNGKNSGKRKREEHDNLCRRFATTSTCPYPEPCKRSHDLQDFIKNTRKPDLGPECVAFKQDGFCRQGIRCRFGKSHIDPETGRNILPPGFDTSKPLQEPGVLNIPERQVLQQLKSAWQKERKNGKKWWNKRKQEQQAKANANTDDDDNKAELTPLDKLPPPRVDWKNKLVCAPLTTVGNLPFRRIVKRYGADITVSEMALASHIISGSPSEWALLKRHESEDVFGIQIAVSKEEEAKHACDLIRQHCQVDFVDLNLGCPIDLLCHRGLGAALMKKPSKVGGIVRTMTESLRTRGIDVTVKMRVGYMTDSPNADVVFKECYDNGAVALALHGRSRQARYTALADWDYIRQTANTVPLPVLGNGDVYDYHDMDHILRDGVDGLMVARSALVKPWIFTELKERRHWDISSKERLEILQDYANYGLAHWGSDDLGVKMTRKFMLEWLSFLWRYVPVGIIDTVEGRDPITDQWTDAGGRTWSSRHHLHQGVPACYGRNDLETLMMSARPADWVKLTEMVLGPVEDGYTFSPKHKARSTDNGDGR